MPFATPRHECQTHAAWQTTQWHRETQASTLRAQRHIHQHESVWDIEWQAVRRDSPPATEASGWVLHPHPLGRSSTYVDGYNRPKVAAVYATARYSQVTGRHPGTLCHRRLRISLSFHNYHFFEGVAVNNLCIKQQRLNAIKFYSN